MKFHFIGNSPIRKNFLANIYGTGVHMISQIILVPFYLLFWGNELYSDWIVISALTSFFTMSDIGLNNVIQNRFAIKLAEGNKAECNILLTVNFILVTVIFSSLLISSILFVVIFDITNLLNIRILSRIDSSIIFVLLIIRVFIDMYRNIENAIYRALHNASRAIMLDQTISLIIALFTFLCLFCGIDIIWMCIFLIIPSLVMLFFKHHDVRKYFDYHFSISQFRFSLLKEIFVPAMSFMSFPIGNAIILQGYTLIVNNFFGANIVVLYNTTRTLGNFVKTLLSTVQNSVWPEYSIAYGKKDYFLMRHLHRRILKITILTSIASGCFILLFGSYIFHIWTQGKVEFNFLLMLIFIIQIFVDSLWCSSSVTLLATNNHIILGKYYLISTLSALCFAVLLGSFGLSLNLIASTLIISNLFMCFYAIPAGFKLTKDKCFTINRIK